MARTPEAIKATITEAFITNPAIIAQYGLVPGQTFEEQFSLVSLENIFFDTMANAIWMQESLWDTFGNEVDAEIAATRPHTVQWYRQKALAFMYGHDLVFETDRYDTTGLTAGQVAAAKIIANAAPVKEILYGTGRIRMKVVKANGDTYAPLSADELTAFNAYMNLVSDAGTLVVPTTGEADLLRLEMDVYYDPLILNPLGQRLDGTDSTPVQSGIKAYLRSLDFNGSLIKTKLVNHLEQVEGVRFPVIKQAWSKYAGYEYTTEGIPNAGLINEIRVADAGHMQLDEAELVINWIAFNE